MSRLRAGFAEVDVTPGPASPMAMGGLVEQGATGVHWPLHGRVALFDDGARRAAIVALDLAFLSAETVAALREGMAAAGALEPADILVSCTHAHNVPKTIAFYGEPADDAYLELLAARLPEAMAAAAAALEPVELAYGRTATERLTFNRRPLYANGEVASGGPRWVEDFVRPESPPDEELQLLLARRPDGSLAGGLIGFACHPHAMLPEPLWSADFCGGATDELARRHGGTFLFLQGACGDLHWVDRSAPSGWTNWWVDPPALMPAARAEAVACAKRQAERLVAAAEAALAAAHPLRAGAIGVERRLLELRQRTPTQEQVALAEAFLAQDPAAVDLDDVNRRMSGRAWTFYENGAAIQRTFAADTIEFHGTQQAGPQPPAELVEVQALALGGVAFAGYPGELFAAFGLRTKERSPFEATFACGLANGSVGYVPTAEAFAHGGYEPRLASWSRLVPDAGDAMVDAALELLGELARAGGTAA